eukprot:scaffold215048_cov60-Cyclotella_meneghiniana.AAC.1
MAQPSAKAATGQINNNGENITGRGYYMSADQRAAVEAMGIRDDTTFATRATDAASRVSSATANTNGADTFRSTTSADNRHNYRDE